MPYRCLLENPKHHIRNAYNCYSALSMIFAYHGMIVEIIDNAKADHVSVIFFCKGNNVVKMRNRKALAPAKEKSTTKQYIHHSVTGLQLYPLLSVHNLLGYFNDDGTN